MIKIFNHHLKLISVNSIFKQGKFQLIEAEMAYDRFDGKSASLKRFIFDRGDAVAVLIFRRSDERICLVEQLRPATLMKRGKLKVEGAKEGVLEIPAGMKEGMETREECLTREVAEEVGRRIKKVRLVTEVYMSPGVSSEKISIFLAEDEGETELPGGGLEEEGEDIRVHWISLKEAKKMVADGRLDDAKTVLAIQSLVLEKMSDFEYSKSRS